MSVGDRLADLSREVMGLYKELVTNSTRFEELDRNTTQMLQEFKHALERMADKVALVEKEHIMAQSDLKAEIRVLAGRLDTLSEKALHTAIERAAEEVAERRMSASSAPRITDGPKLATTKGNLG